VIAAERLDLVPTTTPIAGRESSGIAECSCTPCGATTRTARIEQPPRESLEQAPTWFADYNEIAPYSSLGIEYRRRVQPHDAAAFIGIRTRAEGELGSE